MVTSTTTEKILFSPNEDGSSRAIGVIVSTSKTSPRYVVAARKEVILSAGAIGSPQLLLLSGVGPSEELAKHNIPIVRELPAVGRNLLDVSHFAHPPALIKLPSTALFRWSYPISCEIWHDLG